MSNRTRQQVGKASRAKGKRGERELANKLQGYGYDAHRGAQHKGSKDSPDVTGLPNIHIECKYTDSLRLYDALHQAKGDAGEEDLPAVFHRRTWQPWVVIMDLEDWMVLYDLAQGFLRQLGAKAE